MQYADIVLKSNAVFTGLDDHPFSGGVAILGNRILAVRQNDDFEDLIGPETSVRTFSDRMIMPGFIDAHTHYFLGSLAASDQMCTEIAESTSEEDCVNMVIEYAKKFPNRKRISGIGWFPAVWGDAPLPSRKSLDLAFPDIPVYLISADVHTFWLNTKALNEAGITGNEVLESGEIGTLEDGSLSGLLFEPEAFLPAIEKVLDLPKDVMKEVQKNFFAHINRSGVTSVSEMSADKITEAQKNIYRVVKEMEEEEDLTIRLHLYPELGAVADYAPALELKQEFCSEKLVVSGLKSFVDGVTSTHTGYLLEPYEDNPKTKGFPLVKKEEAIACVAEANRNGFGVRFHGIGDGAVRFALDVFEAANQLTDNLGNRKGLRNAIEHCETIHKDDLPRFAALGVIASMQPYHLVMDLNEKIVRMGEARSKTEWPHRSLLAAGAKMAFGTDYPVVDFNPFPSIYAAITRCDESGTPTGFNPDEVISLSDALKAYTSGSAYVYSREGDLGTLEAGKLADLVVINRNLFEVDPIELLDCEVLLTMMDGKIVYQK